MTRPTPNVLVIFADDMGWGDLGCYGATHIPTPAMDRLATEGVRLTDCHSCSAVCTPSRYGLLTGRYSWRGPLKSGVLRGYSPPIIEPWRPTLASVLRDSGYATGGFGKWHLGLGWGRNDGTAVADAFSLGTSVVPGSYTVPDVDHIQPFDGGPCSLGFDRFFGMAASLDMPPYCFLEQDRVLDVPDRDKEIYHGNQRPGPQAPGWSDELVDVRFVEEAGSWIRAQAAAGGPFFCYVASSAPHRPWVPPDFIRGRSEAGSRADMVCMVDWMVGQLLDVLDETGVAEDTLVIVTSDNGATLAKIEGNTPPEHKSNGDWRGQKCDVWEGGHREPFLARWPGHIPAGGVRDQLVCLTDLVATVAAATDVKLPEGSAEDSVNQLSVLTGHATDALRRSAVHHSANGTFAFRHEMWKLVLGSGSGGFTQPQGRQCDATFADGQLYDLSNDPSEQHNLWAQHPNLVAELYTELKATCQNRASGLSFDVPSTLRPPLGLNPPTGP